MSLAAAATMPAASARLVMPRTRNVTLHTCRKVAATSGHSIILPHPQPLPSGLCRAVNSILQRSYVIRIERHSLGALDIRAVRGHHHDLRTGPDKRRDHGAHAVGKDSRLIG